MPTMSRQQAEALGIIPKKKRSKYNVDHSVEGKAKRTFRGRVYSSQRERDYAARLWANIDAGGSLQEIAPQPFVQLGEDFTYKPDFLLIFKPGFGQAYYIDVKGAEDKHFRRVRKLWLKYGRLPLHIVKKSGPIEVLNPP